MKKQSKSLADQSSASNCAGSIDEQNADCSAAKRQPHRPLSVGPENQLRVTNEKGQRLFGSFDEAFINGFAHDIISVSNTGAELDEEKLSYVAAIVEGIEPRDQLEAMLAIQMAATHKAMIRAGSWLAAATYLEQIENAEKAFNKLARTFTAQMETLKRYRSEPVRVRDVNVADGGQAIVGNVSSGRAENGKS